MRGEHPYNDAQPVRHIRNRSYPHAHPGIDPNHPVLAAVLEGQIFALVEFAHDRAAHEPDYAPCACFFDWPSLKK